MTKNAYRILFLLVIVLLFSGGALSAPFRRDVVIMALCFGVAAAAYDLSAGFTGLASLGPIIPFGLGAYSYSLILLNTNNFIFALSLSVISTAIIGGLLFLLIIRNSDNASIWLVFGLICSLILEQVAIVNTSLLGGANGMIISRYFSPSIEASLQNFSFYVFSISLLCSVLALLIWSVYGHRGAKLLLAGTDPGRLKELGIEPSKIRIQAILVSWLSSALAGALFVSASGSINPSIFGLENNLTILVAASAFGTKTLIRPALIAFAVILFENFMGSYIAGYQTLILGVTYITALYIYTPTRFRDSPDIISAGTYGLRIL